MKVAVLVLAVALVLGGLVGVLMARDPGYVLVVYQDVAVETSLWLALALVLVLYLLFRAFGFLLSRLRGGGRLRDWNQRRRNRAARDQTARGLLLIAEGRWQEARKLLEGAADRVEAPLINYLNAARAANETGDTAGRDALLHAAADAAPDAGVGVGLTQAALQRDREEWNQCLATLLRLRREAPRNGRALRMLADCYRQLGDWQALAELLNDLRKHGEIDPQALRDLTLTAWRGRVDQAGSAVAEVWRSAPEDVRLEPALVTFAAPRLAAAGAVDEAAESVRTALDRTWDPALVDLYGSLVTTDPTAQRAAAERWLEAHPRDPDLRLALGRISLMNHQWESAREHLAASLELRRGPVAQSELGRLCVAQGERERGVELLLGALESLPALPLPDRSEGVRSAERS